MCVFVAVGGIELPQNGTGQICIPDQVILNLDDIANAHRCLFATQSQRLEDQRTEPPIPVGIQGLLDLLLTAQGTRMEDQRSALPPALTAPSLLGGPSTFPGQFVNPPADSSLERMWF